MTDYKRKASDTSMDSCKKVKEETNKNTGVILEDQLPDGMFHLGDNVFVYPSTFKGHMYVHVRRYKKYGSKLYPTREGVTLQPWLIPDVMQRSEIPQTITDLQILPDNQLKIESSDFQNFTFTRIKSQQEGECFAKSITITGDQWRCMRDQYCAISTTVSDEVYSSIDFLKAYKDFYDVPTDLPSSLDVSLGLCYLTESLEKSFCKYMTVKSEGCLKEPETHAEELLGNRKETFNNTALCPDVQEIVHIFYESLFEHPNFLALRPDAYVTQNFLKNVCLKKVLQKSRNYFCPEDANEYFEDFM